MSRRQVEADIVVSSIFPMISVPLSATPYANCWSGFLAVGCSLGPKSPRVNHRPFSLGEACWIVVPGFVLDLDWLRASSSRHLVGTAQTHVKLNFSNARWHLKHLGTSTPYAMLRRGPRSTCFLCARGIRQQGRDPQPPPAEGERPCSLMSRITVSPKSPNAFFRASSLMGSVHPIQSRVPLSGRGSAPGPARSSSTLDQKLRRRGFTQQNQQPRIRLASNFAPS